MHKKVFWVVLALALSACTSNVKPAVAITVSMNEFGYSPTSIEVSAGQPVKLTINNEGLIEHDFVIEKIDVSSVSVTGSGVGEHHMSGDHVDYDLHVSTSAGGTSVLKFTPNQAGTYKVFCSVVGHEEAGMIGDLIVSE